MSVIRIFIGVLFCLLFFSDFVVLTLGLGSVFVVGEKCSAC